MCDDLATATGALIGGWLYQSVGAVLMFCWVGLGIALALLAAGAAARYLAQPDPSV